MNTDTITELKLLNATISKLVALFDIEQAHRKLIALTGMCYVANSDTGITAFKITKVEIQKEKVGSVVIYFDRVEVRRESSTVEGLVFDGSIYVCENRPKFFTLQNALANTEFEGYDLMKSAQFDNLKTMAKHRMDSAWDDLSETSAV